MTEVSDLVDLSEGHSKSDPQGQNGVVRGHDDLLKQLNGQNSVFASESESSRHGQENSETSKSHDTSNVEENRTHERRAQLLSQGSSYKSEETPTNADMTIFTALDGMRHGAREKKLSDGDSAGYDTHSDSIETLEEESSHDDISNDLSDSIVRQISLTSPHQSTHIPETVKTEEKDDLDITAPRPESLSLPRPLQQFERIRSNSEAEVKKTRSDPRAPDKARTQSEIIEIKNRKRTENLDSDLCLSKSLPHGTIMRKGEMIEFVAEDLQEKIRRSSPMSRTDSSCYSSRRSSLRSVSSSTSATTSMATSTASGISRSPSSLFQQSPDDIPPIDPQALFDLENQALLVADSIDLMMGNLKSNLHKMSSITIGCLDAYRQSVDTTCESVDGSIKSMYALMAKCEELSKNMQPVYKLAEKIKEIKRLLDLFEAQLTDKT